jgi:hypothetical protein
MLDMGVAPQVQLRLCTPTAKTPGCNQWKRVEDFPKAARSRKDGKQLYRSQCLACTNLYQKQYRMEPQVAVKRAEQGRNWKKSHRGKASVQASSRAMYMALRMNEPAYQTYLERKRELRRKRLEQRRQVEEWKRQNIRQAAS